MITKCSRPTYWYHDHVGEVFVVTEKDGEWCMPLGNGHGLMFIVKEDTEIFDRKKKIERIMNKLNLYK